MGVEDFKRKFEFRKEGSLFIGVERECHLVGPTGDIVPMAAAALGAINDPHFGFELSACQLEVRTDPVQLDALQAALLQDDGIADRALEKISLGRSHKEVAPWDMPLDVYPDPTGRYQQLTKEMPVDVLRAACRVIGTHVHVGMPDHETALWVYNAVIGHTDELVALGDGSNGKRMELYRVMAPDATPRPYASWDDFYEYACAKGFSEDPRKCWTLVRISPHGTIEFRMFGTTKNVDTIVGWARRCHEHIVHAMKACA